MDRLERTPLETTVYRHTAPAYPPLSGDGARRQGGRWNPADSYPVVYTALDVATVDLELVRAARRAGLTGSIMGHRRLATIRVRLSRVLDLTSEHVRAALGVSEADLTGDDPVIPQAIGETAHHLGYEAGSPQVRILLEDSGVRPSGCERPGKHLRPDPRSREDGLVAEFPVAM